VRQIIFAIFIAATISPAYANITNGSFENWTGQQPDGWTSIESGISVEENSRTTISGNTSAKVTITTRRQSITDFRQTIEVVAGETYQFEVSVHHTEGSISARLYVDGFRGYSNERLTGQWQTLAYEFTASRSETIEVGLRFYDRSGFDGTEIVYVDNFLPGPASQPTPEQPDAATCQTVEVALTTDRYGAETSWELLSADGSQIANGANFSSNTDYTEQLCLEDGDYTFTINDDYGDGICCRFGAGRYAISANDNIVIEGGEFGTVESKNFTIRSNGQSDPAPDAELDPYYSDAKNLTGFALKTSLHNIIRDHSSQGYGALWRLYGDVEIDLYFEKDGSVLDIYSENPTGAESYIFTVINDQCGNFRQEGDCYNREHSFPRSWFGGDREPMNSDAHHIFLTDGFVNSKRASHPYGEVASTTFTSSNGSKVGLGRSGLGYTGFVFEPVDAFKGDIARAQLYMATRYENLITTWASNSSAADAALNRSRSQVFEDWYLDLLLSWHAQDPVSQKEIDRNNAVFVFQGNRNPFVDVPEFVDLIWR